jgi:hypothetical protein
MHERGKKFYEFVTAKAVPYVDCTGINLETREEINDKVIVNMKSYFNADTMTTRSFHPPGALDVSETSDCSRGVDCPFIGDYESRCYHRQAKIIVDQLSDMEAYQTYIDEKTIEFTAVPQCVDDSWLPDFTICHHRDFAYKLRSREWGT